MPFLSCMSIYILKVLKAVKSHADMIFIKNPERGYFFSSHENGICTFLLKLVIKLIFLNFTKLTWDDDNAYPFEINLLFLDHRFEIRIHYCRIVQRLMDR